MFRLDIGLWFDESLSSNPTFLTSGVTCAILKLIGKAPYEKVTFASRVMTEVKALEHSLSKDVEKKKGVSDDWGESFGTFLE